MFYTSRQKVNHIYILQSFQNNKILTNVVFSWRMKERENLFGISKPYIWSFNFISHVYTKIKGIPGKGI